MSEDKEAPVEEAVVPGDTEEEINEVLEGGESGAVPEMPTEEEINEVLAGTQGPSTSTSAGNVPRNSPPAPEV